MYLLLLFSAAACSKERDVLAEAPMLRKIEWHVHAFENYTQPWLDSMTARVVVRITKIDTMNKTTQTFWDTTFAPRPIREYPLLPQKYIIEKLVPVLRQEKLQVWYNIRYEMAGAASETGRLDAVQQPFTFIDIKL